VNQWGKGGAGNASWILMIKNAEIIIGNHDGVSTSFVYGNAELQVDQWYHVAGVWDGSTGFIYINGILDNFASLSRVPQDSDYPVKIGRAAYLYATSPNYFDGVIDEVYIFNRALSATEVEELYQAAQLPMIETSPSEFSFYADDGNVPQPQTLLITNTGAGQLNWQITENCDWLQVDPNSGSSTGEPNEVILSVDASGLRPGWYSYGLAITADGASNSPKTVAIDLLIGGIGQIHVPVQYPTIQAGINAALPGDTVIIADGTYTGQGNKNLDFGGRNITLRSRNDPENCIIDCENDGRGFYFHSGEDGNCIVTGLTVKNGTIEGTFDSPTAFGGGICCDGASPKIINCHILDNSAYGFCEGPAGGACGGGIACIFYSNPEIVNCKIAGNLASVPAAVGGGADAYGGGVFCGSGSTVVIYNCEITTNRAHGGKVLFEDSWITYACDSYGGGIYIDENPDSKIENCLVADNETVLVVGEDDQGPNYGDSRGAGIFCDNWVSVTNCTIVGNYTEPAGVRGEGGGIYGPPTVINNIIRANLMVNT